MIWGFSSYQKPLIHIGAAITAYALGGLLAAGLALMAWPLLVRIHKAVVENIGEFGRTGI